MSKQINETFRNIKENLKTMFNDVKVYKTNNKDFKMFIEECLYWRNKLGLLEYEWTFNHITLPELAGVLINVEDSLAAVDLSKEFVGTPVTNYSIRKAAFHEVIEIMLGEVNIMMMEKNIKESQKTKALHRIIKRLENTMFIPDFNKRFKTNHQY